MALQPRVGILSQRHFRHSPAGGADPSVYGLSVVGGSLVGGSGSNSVEANSAMFKFNDFKRSAGEK